MAKLYSRMTRRLFKRFRAEEYEQLQKDMAKEAMGVDEISAYFQAEGHVILKWAVCRWSDTKPLKFLCNTVDRKTLQSVLDHAILQSQLYTQAGLESLGMWNPERAKRQIETYQLLLWIDAPGVTAFMAEKNSSSCSYLTDASKTCFKLAGGDIITK